MDSNRFSTANEMKEVVHMYTCSLKTQNSMKVVTRVQQLAACHNWEECKINECTLKNIHHINQHNTVQADHILPHPIQQCTIRQYTLTCRNQ